MPLASRGATAQESANPCNPASNEQTKSIPRLHTSHHRNDAGKFLEPQTPGRRCGRGQGSGHHASTGCSGPGAEPSVQIARCISSADRCCVYSGTLEQHVRDQDLQAKTPRFPEQLRSNPSFVAKSVDVLFDRLQAVLESCQVELLSNPEA